MNAKDALKLHELALKTDNYSHPRPLLAGLRSEAGRHFTGILGPRGVGKTVLLKQLASSMSNSLYLSMDTLDSGTDLFDLLNKLHRDYKISSFLFDEVHFFSGIEAILKRLYDNLRVRVWFTSSVALAMHDSAYDLSRRIQLKTLFPFSYREFLFFRHGVKLSSLSLEDIFNCRWSGEHMRAGIHFDEFIKGGLMPFSLEEPEPLQILGAIRDTVIRKDIPRVTRLHTDELDILEKCLKFIGKSPVDGINYSSISKNLGITKYKAEQYLELFEKAFILHRVFPKGTNVLKEPKVLLAPPYRLLYTDYEQAIGGLREDYFAEAMRSRDIDFSYLKTTRGGKTPDYVMEAEVDGNETSTVIEVGGRRKGYAQFKNYTADRRFIFTHSDVTDAERRPLFMLGMG